MTHEFEITNHADMLEETDRFIKAVLITPDLKRGNRKMMLDMLHSSRRLVEEQEYVAWCETINAAAKIWRKM